MCSLCRLPVAFWGDLYRPPFSRWGPNLVCYSRPAVYTYVPNFVSIGLICRPLAEKNPNFCHILPYFGLRHLVMSPMAAVWESWTRMHNYKPFPIQRYQNRFCTLTPSCRNRAHNLWRSKPWRTDRQTNRQKNSTFLATPAAGEIQAPPNLAWW